VGAVIGFVKGKSAATIPGAPLVSSISELFEFSRSREMRDGDFGNLLESNLITEIKPGELDKVQFKTRESMHQAYDSTIIDPQRSPDSSVSDMNIPQDLIEGNYRADGSVGDANKIRRREPELVFPDEIQADSSVKKISTENNEVKSIIPNQIDLNSDSLAPLERSENFMQSNPINDTSTPREKPKPEIPSQIDFSKEIIR